MDEGVKGSKRVASRRGKVCTKGTRPENQAPKKTLQSPQIVFWGSCLNCSDTANTNENKQRAVPGKKKPGTFVDTGKVPGQKKPGTISGGGG